MTELTPSPKPDSDQTQQTFSHPDLLPEQMLPSQPETPATQPVRAVQQESSDGCLSAGLFGGMASWILLTSAVSQVIAWVIEQSIFDGSLDTPDMRWLIALIFGGVVLVPAWAIASHFKARSEGRFFRAFALAGVFVLFLAPARLAGLTEALATAGLQIVSIVLFLLLMMFVFDRGQERLGLNLRGLSWALLMAGVVGIPWVLWGALGSIWDTILNLIVALLFGVAAAWILQRMFLREVDQEYSRGRFLMEGFAAALTLLVMVTGLGINGNQGLLSLTVPVLGWALAAVCFLERSIQGRMTSNWLALALLAGLAAFWPLAWIDPDELASVVTLGVGELIQWANLAAFVSLILGIGLGLLALVLLSSFWRRQSFIWIAGIGAGLVWLALPVLYLVAGQPGFFGERLYVVMREQADLSGAEDIEDYNQRRQYVYDTLVAHADATQADLRSALDRFFISYQPYYLENAIEVQGGPLIRLWLESRPEVDRVLDSPRLRPLPAPVPPSEGTSSAPTEPQWNLTMIGADKVWEEFGITGAGVIVGQSDSGAQMDHPELADAYLGRDGSHDYHWYDPWNHTTAPTDIGGHGTHTLGTALGNNVGVAPDAEWIGCTNLARNLGNPALYLDCMQFMLAPFPQDGDPLRDGQPERGAHVLNNSWGCPEVEGCDPAALQTAVSALRAAGVFVVSSAGNDGRGGCGSLEAPIALYDAVYSVGAVNSTGEIAEFSSLGPVTADGSQRIKPDIAAPGVNVLSSYPGGTYSRASGTSMAGPHVAGTVALIWSANPDLIGDIDRTEEILNASAAPFEGVLPACVAPGTPNNAVGYGVLDAYEAVRMALEDN